MKPLSPTDAQAEAVAVLSRAAKQNQSDAGKRYGRGKPRGIAFPKIDKIHLDDELAKMFHVSKGYIHEARKIKEFCDERGYPQIFEQMRNGTLGIQEAKRRIQSIAACMLADGELESRDNGES